VAGGARAPFILTDTVGFIRKLPHQLVEAFKATLEELEEADLLLHVVDASHAGLEEQAAAVESLLLELGLGERPTIVALNKIDRIEGGAAPRMLVGRFDGVPISARSGQGLDRLLDRIEEMLRGRVERAVLRIPYRDGQTLALCYERGRVLDRSDEPDGIRLEVELPPRLLAPLRPYREAG